MSNISAMVVLVLVVYRKSLNPDNIATPFAATIGDLLTIGMMVWNLRFVDVSLLVMHCFTGITIFDICFVFFVASVTAYVCKQHRTRIIPCKLQALVNHEHSVLRHMVDGTSEFSRRYYYVRICRRVWQVFQYSSSLPCAGCAERFAWTEWFYSASSNNERSDGALFAVFAICSHDLPPTIR